MLRHFLCPTFHAFWAKCELTFSCSLVIHIFSSPSLSVSSESQIPMHALLLQSFQWVWVRFMWSLSQTWRIRICLLARVHNCRLLQQTPIFWKFFQLRKTLQFYVGLEGSHIAEAAYSSLKWRELVSQYSLAKLSISILLSQLLSSYLGNLLSEIKLRRMSLTFPFLCLTKKWVEKREDVVQMWVPYLSCKDKSTHSEDLALGTEQAFFLPAGQDKKWEFCKSNSLPSSRVPKQENPENGVLETSNRMRRWIPQEN